MVQPEAEVRGRHASGLKERDTGSRTLWSGSTHSSHVLHSFSAATGKRQLREGKFAVFKSIPVFESDFIQISTREVTDVYDSVQMVPAGAAYTSPNLTPHSV